MGFEYLTNVPLAQARKEYLERLVSGGFGSKTETIPVFESCGRVTAKAVYAHTTAAVLRAKDCVMQTVTTIREGADDILADAKALNEKYAAEDAPETIEDAAE